MQTDFVTGQDGLLKVKGDPRPPAMGAYRLVDPSDTLEARAARVFPDESHPSTAHNRAAWVRSVQLLRERPEGSIWLLDQRVVKAKPDAAPGPSTILTHWADARASARQG